MAIVYCIFHAFISLKNIIWITFITTLSIRYTFSTVVTRICFKATSFVIFTQSIVRWEVVRLAFEALITVYFLNFAIIIFKWLAQIIFLIAVVTHFTSTTVIGIVGSNVTIIKILKLAYFFIFVKIIIFLAQFAQLKILVLDFVAPTILIFFHAH